MSQFVSKGRFFSRGSPDAPWVTSAEYRRVLRDSNEAGVEWMVCVCFVFVFLCLCLIWRWCSKGVRIFPIKERVLTTWQVLKTAAIFKVFGRWMYAYGTSSHRLQSPSMILFVLPHKPSSCPQMLNLKNTTKPCLFFFSRKPRHTTSPSFFRWADLLSAS